MEVNRPACFAHPNQEEFLGTAISWLGLEIIMFFSYTFTLVLVLVKLQCNQPISADNSNMFGNRYMSYMANIICQTLVKHA